MNRAAAICPKPGCPNLTPCADHPKIPWAGSRRRDHVRKSGWQQQADAQRILRIHHRICHVCGGDADEVDHVIPLGEGGTDDDSNKRPICSSPCHKNKTQAEAARARRHAAG